MNERGVVTGTSQTDKGAVHAFLYTPGVGMRDLGVGVFPTDISDTGNLIGRLSPSNDAFFWSVPAGSRTSAPGRRTPSTAAAASMARTTASPGCGIRPAASRPSPGRPRRLQRETRWATSRAFGPTPAWVQYLAQRYACEAPAGGQTLERGGAIAGALIAYDHLREPILRRSARDSSAGLFSMPVNFSR